MTSRSAQFSQKAVVVLIEDVDGPPDMQKLNAFYDAKTETLRYYNQLNNDGCLINYASTDLYPNGAPVASNNDSCDHHASKKTHPVYSSPMNNSSCNVVQSLVSSPTKKLSFPISSITHSCIQTQRDSDCEDKPPSPINCVEAIDQSSTGCERTKILDYLLQSSISRLNDKSLCLMSSRISHFSSCGCKFMGNETDNYPGKCVVCMDKIDPGKPVNPCESDAGW